MERNRRTWIAIVALLVLSIALILWEVRQSESGNTTVVEQIAGTAARPVQSAISSIDSSLEKRAHGKELLKDAVRLESENAGLRAELTRLQAAEKENQRLRELLDFKEKLKLISIPAMIIEREPASWTRLVIINKGASDGITPDFYIQDPRGVIGRVVRTTNGTALVRLLIDHRCTVPAKTIEGGSHGILRGDGKRFCRMEYLDSTASIKPGDTVVTSGMGKIFPPGILLGKVVKVTGGSESMFKEVLVEPGVDFSSVSEVLAVKKN
ncbi:MAG: rod shape-determining protein MreC [Chloroflexi bacterium]|nr:rod shape-determining protein MreC [Chloroflexota bacterium]